MTQISFSLEELLAIGNQLRDPNPNFPQQRQLTENFIQRLAASSGNAPAVLTMAARWLEAKGDIPQAKAFAAHVAQQASQELDTIHLNYRISRFYGEPLEANLWLDLLLSKDPRAPAIQSYLKMAQPSAVVLGPGEHVYPGWLHFDAVLHNAQVLPFDAREPLPLPDNSADYIYSEHMIEHINYHEGGRLLKEIFRVLKPGGRVRIATPDLERVCALAGDNLSEVQKSYIHFINSKYYDTRYAPPPIEQSAFPINNMFFAYSHSFVHDQHSLGHLMVEAGLNNVTRCEHLKSSDPFMCNLEMHHLLGDIWVEEYQTLILEAQKPL